MSSRLSRIHVLPAAAFIATTLASGCATKGYVNDRLDEVRRADEENATALARLENSTEEALERARLAADSAGGARELALGHAGLEEINRYTVYFSFDSDLLLDTETGTLQEAATEISAHPEAIVDVYGFADPAGPDGYNLDLGQRRATEVVRYLVAASPHQLSRYAAVSFGERDLADMTSPAQDNEQSRRVVISLIRRIPLEGAEPASASVTKGS